MRCYSCVLRDGLTPINILAELSELGVCEVGKWRRNQNREVGGGLDENTLSELEEKLSS